MIRFKVKVTTEGCAPTKAHPSDSGWDLYAAEDAFLPSKHQKIVDCGIEIELPEGYEAQVRPRSGLAANHSITIVNSPGTIDNSYRGPIKVILYNLGSMYYEVEKGDRIGQLVIKAIEPSEYEIVNDLSNTERGDGHFGSSGY